MPEPRDPKDTKLGKIVAASASGNGYGRIADSIEADAKTRLGQLQLVAARGEFVDVPVIGRVWIQLLPHQEEARIEAAAWKALESLGMPAGEIRTRIVFEAERAVRTLAIALRDPDDLAHRQVFGSLEQWAALDHDLITIAYQAYADTRNRLNPLASTTQLTDDEWRYLRAAHEKKSPTGLLVYGVVKLARYTLTTECPPSRSTTSESSPGPSSPDTSSPTS